MVRWLRNMFEGKHHAIVTYKMTNFLRTVGSYTRTAWF